MEWWIAGYWGVGLIVGFLNGLLGTGGGATMVLLLTALFEAQHFPPQHVLPLAIATAMATIVCTSAASLRAHALRGAVRGDILRALTPGILVGALAGATLAAMVPRAILAAIFVTTVYAAALNLLFATAPRAGRRLPGALGSFVAGAVISGVSACTAVGGAFLTVPFMRRCNVPVAHAVGTAAALGLPIALAGMLVWLGTGVAQAGLPAGSWGYVYAPALLGMIAASIAAAPLGAALAHRLPGELLRKLFAAALIAAATRMLVAWW